MVLSYMSYQRLVSASRVLNTSIMPSFSWLSCLSLLVIVNMLRLSKLLTMLNWGVCWHNFLSWWFAFSLKIVRPEVLRLVFQPDDMSIFGDRGLKWRHTSLAHTNLSEAIYLHHNISIKSVIWLLIRCPKTSSASEISNLSYRPA
jgi:hypothetical protein